ncbi:MAG: nucleotidyltransferase [Anaerolineaceae bacterium]|jgi:hypothetical protein
MKEVLARINEVLEKLDLSPTMHQDATEKYKNVCSYFENQGIEADFYPQGSFSFGTVVRPFSEGKNKKYDLDVICQVNIPKENIDPDELKNNIGDTLKNSEVYRQRLDIEGSKSWTINYSGIGEFEFDLDVVPSVKDEKGIVRLLLSGVKNEIAQTSISITDKLKDSQYQWVSSNPSGLTKWFVEINQPFFNFVASDQKAKIFSTTKMYNTIEDVPDYVVKTSLQRAIQFLKRHRDIYFWRVDKETKKPTSIVILVLICEFAKSIHPATEILDLISMFVQSTLNNCPISKTTPYLANPAEPNDNLVDSWDQEMIDLFYTWLKSLNVDLIELKSDGVIAIKSADNILYAESLGLIDKEISIQSKPISIQTKPWLKIKNI